MPRCRQSTEQRRAVCERILDAAQMLMQEHGPEALSMRGIAERAHMSPMALYTYFQGRAALVSQLMERQRERMHQHRTEMIQRARRGQVKAVIQDFFAFFAQAARLRPGIFRFLWVLPLNSEDAGLDARQGFDKTLGLLVDLIQIGIEQGDFAPRDAALAATTVFGMTHGSLLLYHSGRLSDATLCEQAHREAVKAALCYLCNP